MVLGYVHVNSHPSNIVQKLKLSVQLSANFFTFTVEILNGKLHFS